MPFFGTCLPFVYTHLTSSPLPTTHQTYALAMGNQNEELIHGKSDLGDYMRTLLALVCHMQAERRGGKSVTDNSDTSFRI